MRIPKRTNARARSVRHIRTAARQVLAIACLVLLTAPASAFTLTIHLRDAADGTPTAARVAIIGPNGQVFLGPDPQLRTHETPGTGPFVHAEDSLLVDLPDAVYNVLALRGTTSRPAVEWIDLSGDRDLVVEIEDWIDPRLDGWYSADTHTHLVHDTVPTYPDIDLEHAGLMARAEGLDLLYLLENDTDNPGGIVTPAQPGTTLVYGEEYRNSFWGHAVLLGLDELVTFDGAGCCGDLGRAWPTLTWTFTEEDIDLSILAHPHTTDTPNEPFSMWPGSGFARERAALALGDLVEGFAVASGSNNGNQWAIDEYLDALRVGARWSAVGETDCAMDRYRIPPPGQPRTFAQVGTGFEPGDPALVAAFEQALTQQRSFATTGPVIRDLRVDGATMGQELQLGAPGLVRVSLDVTAASPLQSVVVHGATGVHRIFNPAAGVLEFTMEFDLQVDHDDFVAVEVQAAPTLWPHQHEPPRAMSSPVWIQAGTPWPTDPALLRRQVDDLQAFWHLAIGLRGFESPADSIAARQDILGAAAQYESMFDDAPGDFELICPAPLEQIDAGTVTLCWTRSASYDGEPTNYHVEVASDASFADLVLTTDVSDTFVVLQTLLAPQSYSWRVSASEPGETPVLAGNAPRGFWYSGGVVSAPAHESGSLFMTRPVPSGNGMQVRMNLPRAGHLNIRWVDARGRQVAANSFGQRAPGVHELYLPARDRNGKALAHGVYWLVASVGQLRAVERVVWMR